MRKAIIPILLLLLGACSAVPQGQLAASACAGNPSGYQCQIDNYFRAP
jgi:hypothetical protein